jgi:HK97 family phage portal protein
MGMFARAATKAFDQGIGTIAAGGHVIQLGGGRSFTGLSITTDKAMRYSAFWAGCRILSEDVAKLPLGVYRQEPDGSRTQVPDHPLDRVIRYQWNPRMTSFTGRQVGMLHDLTWGNAFNMIGRDQNGRGAIRELWPLATDRMTIHQSPVGELGYRYQRLDGTVVELDPPDVFHVPAFSWDGINGYSVIRQARESIGLGLATEEHGARFFGNGATSNFVLATDATLSPTALGHINESIDTERTGLTNSWRPWVLEEGLKPVTIAMPHDDAQWLETRNHQVVEIARWFRLPPHKLADLSRATFANIEHLSLEYVIDTLMGWLVRWEMALGQQLLGEEWVGQGGDLYVKFNVSALLRGDLKSRFEAYAIGRQWGFMNGDRIAELEDWNRWDGGDAYIVPLNMTTVNPDGSITTATMGPAGAPAPAVPVTEPGSEGL